MATALQLIQQATAEMGLAVPTVVTGSTSTDNVQLMALLNAVGYELERGHPWQAVDTEYRFTTQYVATTGTTTTGSPIITGLATTAGVDATYMVAGTGVNQDTYVLTNDSASQVTMTQAATASGTVAVTFCKSKYPMPAGYDRSIDNTEWDKSKHWRMQGPATSQQWQLLKSGFIATGPRITFRMIGGYFEIWPLVSANEYLGFEYVSQYWARDASSVPKPAFTADADTCIFPDRLMVLGLKLKYWEIKGFDTVAFARDYQAQLDIAKANDAGSQTLSFAPRRASILVNQSNLPDSGYGQ